jgi:two-component system response regulator AtoC
MEKKPKAPSYDSHPIAPLSEITAEAEKAHIMKTLKSTYGNRTKAAEILGISRKTLWEKLKAHGIAHEYD